MDDNVVLYRGDINALGQVIPRAELPANAVPVPIAYYESVGDSVRELDAFLVRE